MTWMQKPPSADLCFARYSPQLHLKIIFVRRTLEICSYSTMQPQPSTTEHAEKSDDKVKCIVVGDFAGACLAFATSELEINCGDCGLALKVGAGSKFIHSLSYLSHPSLLFATSFPPSFPPLPPLRAMSILLSWPPYLFMKNQTDAYLLSIFFSALAPCRRLQEAVPVHPYARAISGPSHVLVGQLPAFVDSFAGFDFKFAGPAEHTRDVDARARCVDLLVDTLVGFDFTPAFARAATEHTRHVDTRGEEAGFSPKPNPEPIAEQLLTSPKAAQIVAIENIIRTQNATLSTLRAEILEVHSAVRAMQKKRNALVEQEYALLAEMRRCNGVLSPIRRLPPEIVGEILLYFTPSLRSDHRVRSRLYYECPHGMPDDRVERVQTPWSGSNLPVLKNRRSFFAISMVRF
ncbi:hypothetical protein C8R47DRAFT_1286111 [Mycena vitilis]|nr:hypothetical protein C8R47DRAFT_1286111 [Mycena vitilis]